jgi:hypothetical protein
MSRTVGIAALMAAALAGPGPARAGCEVPPPELVWSYPADGQTDVPTNATIWILLPNWTQPGSVSLDGVPIPVNEFGFGYVPAQPLAPGSPHQVTFRATPARVQPPVDLTIRFTTGAGPADGTPPSPPAVPSASATATRALPANCQRVLDAMECFDTGPRFHLVFATSATPLLWIIESAGSEPGAAPTFELWPGSCGPPEAFVEDAATRACNRRFLLHAVTEAGLRATSAPLCPGELVTMPLPPAPAMPDASAEPLPDPSPPDAGAPPTGPAPPAGGARGSDPMVHETESRSACAIAGRGEMGVAWLALLLVPLVRRRRR